ncbi:hypothetical protein [Marinobacter salsuginis]|jgi:hypothetical protein|uniref:Uncharacterized protein n=1 Tax=Marinobacter salsuginis TaxID=418719 RepID=A0A5M3Q0Q9_9GAMM|nr:hypothetical protein [Marinobacter salsuginis]GBO88636.1 hypothetical protein MSSD14B_23040 [Marinobacter salsuginis]
MFDKVLRVLGVLAGLVGISAGAFFLNESFDSLLPEAMIFWSLACFLTGGFSLFWALRGSVILTRLIGGKFS